MSDTPRPTAGFLSATPVQPLSLDHAGFFREGALAYQMVPHGGNREVVVSYEGGAVNVTSLHPEIAQIGYGESNVPDPKNLLKFPAGEVGGRFFKIYGKQVGNTLIAVEDKDGRYVNALKVSVKRNITKTYELLILQDIRRKSKRSFEDLLQIMGHVQTLYLKQANVTLRQVYMPNVMYIEADLGDPIDVKLSAGDFRSWLADEVKTRNDQIGATKQDFTIVSSWNIKDRDNTKIAGVDPAYGSVMFCSDLSEGPANLLNASLFAHELAHAFKCVHRLDPANLLMQLNVGSCQMSDTEIDKINPTGL